MSLDDPFDDPGGGLQRDRWGRPIILRPWEEDGECAASKGKRWNCHIEKAHGHYTRTSTFAGTLDDGPGLAIWMKRHVALGVAKQPDLRAIIAGMSYTDGQELDKRIEEVLIRMAARDMEFQESIRKKGDRSTDASLRAANWGTAFHRFTEPNSPPEVPEELIGDVEAFHEAISKTTCPRCREQTELLLVSTEASVVTDRWYTAGTFDHAVQCAQCDEVMVLDKKTTKDLHPTAMCIQLTNYAHGVTYDDHSGERIPLPYKLSKRHGIIAWVPIGSNHCKLVPFDLKAGERVCDLAFEVRQLRLRENDLMQLTFDQDVEKFG